MRNPNILTNKAAGFGPEEAEERRKRSAAIHEVAGLGVLAAPAAAQLAGHAAHALHLNGPVGTAVQAAGTLLEKNPVLGHSAELAGLGILARPSIQELRQPAPAPAQPAPAKTASWKDRLRGGLADGKTPRDFDAGALRQGQRVEAEHTDDPRRALEISMDHLSEDPHYYQKLKKVEKRADDARYISTEDRAAWRGRGLKAAECSLGRDERGFYCYTHRARSKSYASVAAIPDSVIAQIASTG